MAAKGYIRGSSNIKNRDRQRETLKRNYPYIEIFRERKGKVVLEEIISDSKPWDVVVFDEITRISDDPDEAFDIYEDMFQRGLKIEFIKDSHINSEIFHTVIDENIKREGEEYRSVIEHSILVLAEKQIKESHKQITKERGVRSKRIREGMLESDKIPGRKAGEKQHQKKEKIAKEIIKTNSTRFYGRRCDKVVIKMAGISRPTFYKYVRSIELDMKNERDDK